MAWGTGTEMDGVELDRIGVWTVVNGMEHATDAGLGSFVPFSVMFAAEL